PHLRRHLARRRAVLSWPRCGTADARLGLDALHAAAGDLRRALRLRPAGVGDLHHVALLQPRQRRAATGHGRAHMKLTEGAAVTAAAGLARGRAKLDTVPPGDARDRGGKIQPMVAANGLTNHLPILPRLFNHGILTPLPL